MVIFSLQYKYQNLIQFTCLKIDISVRCSLDLDIYLERKARWLVARKMVDRVRRRVGRRGSLIFHWPASTWLAASYIYVRLHGVQPSALRKPADICWKLSESKLTFLKALRSRKTFVESSTKENRGNATFRNKIEYVGGSFLSEKTLPFRRALLPRIRLIKSGHPTNSQKVWFLFSKKSQMFSKLSENLTNSFIH